MWGCLCCQAWQSHFVWLRDECSKSVFDYMLLWFKIKFSLKRMIKHMSLAANQRVAFVIVLWGFFARIIINFFFFFNLMANVILNALRSFRYCHLLRAGVVYQKKCGEKTHPIWCVWLLLLPTITSPCFLTFFEQLRNTNRYSFVSPCRHFALRSLCITALNPQDLVPPKKDRKTWLHVCRGWCRRSAPCRVITVTRLSPRSTRFGSTMVYSHQSARSASCASCRHAMQNRSR